MYRYLFRFAVMSITILTANLITNSISNWLVTFRNQMKPLTFTLMGMAITVIIFYPLFALLEDRVKDLSAKVIKKGKSLAGKYVGLVVTFALCIAILSWFYARMWYHINLLHVVFPR